MAESKLFKEVKKYARDIVSGEIIANEDRVLAAKRFLKDLDNAAYEMRTRDADFVIKIIEATFVHIKGPARGKAFLLEPWEKFICYNVAGFYIAGTEERRFKEAFIFLPRKNSKTFFASALAWALSLLERQYFSVLYIIATKLDRAMEAFENIRENIEYMGESKNFKILNNNAILEDNDVNLATELISAIGKAIGKALDKAILYGKNVKMPMGIVTSLLLAEAPAGYPETGRKWEDLSTSHVITGTNATGTKLFQDITKATGVIDNDYATGNIVWVMNKKTHTKLIAEGIGVNSAAAIVAGGAQSTMPIVGGNIEELKFIPDNTIIFGYFENYVLAERAGTVIGQSEHVRFIEDQTVFKGTARYDGDLAIREAFAVYGVGGAPVTEAPKFAGEA